MKFTLIPLLAICLSLPMAGQDMDDLLPQNVRLLKAQAQQGNHIAQFDLGCVYDFGEGVLEDNWEAAKWYHKSAMQGYVLAQYNLALMYLNGEGVVRNARQAAWWFDKAAKQGNAKAQFHLGVCYDMGNGVLEDNETAFSLYALAAVQGHSIAQNCLGVMLATGEGVKMNVVAALAWYSISAVNGFDIAKKNCAIFSKRMNLGQIEEAKRLALGFIAKWPAVIPANKRPEPVPAARQIKGTGTGFFITDNGYILTNHHVVEGANRVSVKIEGKTLNADIIKVDVENDLAVLKVDGVFPAIPLVDCRNVKLGDSVFTMGFPRPKIQGNAIKHTAGQISCLVGLRNDPENFQHSVPIQPGNSGGALVDSIGNVVGIIVSRLDIDGAQNVNYAVKSATAMDFIRTLPFVFKKLKKQRQRKAGENFNDCNRRAIDDTEKATVMIIVS